jgi:RNA polymerase sigma factor (sigma-70 family)
VSSRYDVVSHPSGPAGFAPFYAASRDDVFRTVLLSLRHKERAEDAVQEAYARAWARWPELSRHPNPVAWVVRVALNADRSAWRLWRREGRDPPDIAAAPDAHEVDPWLLRRVWDLPVRQRQVVALRILADLDTEATASALGIAPGTVTAHLHRALSSLRSVVTGTDVPEVTS